MKARAVLAIASALLLSRAVSAPGQNPPVQPPQPAPASTDVFVYRMDGPERGRIINVTNRVGYDNQPAWDGPAIMWTSQRDGQTDIYRGDVERSSAGRVT